MHAFLRQTKRAVAVLAENCAQAAGNVDILPHFILGNESCDLDSAMSAIVFAWFMTKVQGQQSATHYIPVLNTDRNQYRLKTETSHLLKKFGVGQGDLVFRDDLNMQDIVKRINGSLLLTLVDHHVFAKQDKILEPFITEVIDHRTQTGEFAATVEVEIETVGSCVTLIAERIQDAITRRVLTPSQDEREGLKYMTAGPILLDTANLRKSAGKVTPRDEKIIDFFWGPDRSELLKFYDELTAAKYSAKGLSAEDLMLKDSKFIENEGGDTKVMFSTLHDTWKNFFERENSKGSVASSLDARECHLWVALAPQECDEAGRTYKPVVLFSKLDELRSKVQYALVASQDPALEMDESQASAIGKHFSFLRMYNTKASRKQVLPVVLHFIATELPTTRIKQDP